MTRAALIAVAVLAALAGCSHKTPAPVASACALLTDSEIQAAQGEVPSERKDSQNTGNGFVVSQCYYTLPTPSKSVILTLTEREPGHGGRDPAEAWGLRFKGGGKARDEQVAGTERIGDLGDDALWMGSHVGGVLYVRTPDRTVRISVGGPDSTAAKRERSVSLARAVLGRL